MNRKETKREIQRLWINWSDRKEFDDSDPAVLTFYSSLRGSNESILSDGDFGLGVQYQIIHAWILKWMQTWGRKQHSEQ